MFVAYNSSTTNPDLLRNIVAPGIADNVSAISAFYRLKSPFALQFTTFHPDTEDQTFLFTSMLPDKIIYSSSSASEQHYAGQLYQPRSQIQNQSCIDCCQRVSFSGTSINDYNFHACILQLPICKTHSFLHRHSIPHFLCLCDII